MVVKAYVLIDVEKGEAGSVAVELNGKPGIVAADVVFGQYDVIARIEVDDMDALESIVRDAIAQADYVAHTQTLLVAPGLTKGTKVQQLSE